MINVYLVAIGLYVLMAAAVATFLIRDYGDRITSLGVAALWPAFMVAVLYTGITGVLDDPPED